VPTEPPIAGFREVDEIGYGYIWKGREEKNGRRGDGVEGIGKKRKEEGKK